MRRENKNAATTVATIACLAGLTLFSASCRTKMSAPGARYQFYSYPAPGTQPPRQVILVYQNSRIYRTMDDFKNFVGSLPQGSILEWETNGTAPSHLAVGARRIPVEELTALAAKGGVTFRYFAGW